MTYLNVLMLCQERGESLLGQDLRSIFTSTHRFLRGLEDPEFAWKEDTYPGSPETVYTKGGRTWVWKRQDLPNDFPLPIPEGQ